MRLRRVGCDKELLAPDAVVLLHQATDGVLREIDRLASWALQLAAHKKRPLVDRGIMAQAIESDQSPFATT